MTLVRRLRLMSTGTKSIPRETALKVAFASGDMKHVDQHFGAAESFVVYLLNPEHAALVEAVQFGRLATDGNEDKLTAKIEALEGCIAVYCQAVGASAITQLQARGVQAVKVSPGAEIAELVRALQDELRQGPGTWVARAVERQKPRDVHRFDDMEQEGWVE